MNSVFAAETQGLSRMALNAGPYVTLAIVSVAVFLLCYLVRAVENYIRHLHRKTYLHYANPRFILSTAGFMLVADGFVIGGLFAERLPLRTAMLTVTAGLVCLLLSTIWSVRPYVREAGGLRRHDRLNRREGRDRLDRREGDGEE